MVVVGIIAGFLLIMNLIGFFSMGIDKRRATKKMWRIPEATLFMIAILGGSVGSLAGMRFFHHKTRHWYFVYGMPTILIIQIVATILLLFYSPIQFYIM